LNTAAVKKAAVRVEAVAVALDHLCTVTLGTSASWQSTGRRRYSGHTRASRPLAAGEDGIPRLVSAASATKSELFNNMEVAPLDTRVTRGRGARTGAAG